MLLEQFPFKKSVKHAGLVFSLVYMLLQNGQFSVYIWAENLVLYGKNKLEADRSYSLEDMNCFAKTSWFSIKHK